MQTVLYAFERGNWMLCIGFVGAMVRGSYMEESLDFRYGVQFFVMLKRNPQFSAHSSY